MTAQTSMLHVRIDDQTKAQATLALEAMGLTVRQKGNGLRIRLIWLGDA